MELCWRRSLQVLGSVRQMFQSCAKFHTMPRFTFLRRNSPRGWLSSLFCRCGFHSVHRTTISPRNNKISTWLILCLHIPDRVTLRIIHYCPPGRVEKEAISKVRIDLNRSTCLPMIPLAAIACSLPKQSPSGQTAQHAVCFTQTAFRIYQKSSKRFYLTFPPAFSILFNL